MSYGTSRESGLVTWFLLKRAEQKIVTKPAILLPKKCDVSFGHVTCERQNAKRVSCDGLDGREQSES